jgi:hypothetical protein
VFSYRSTTGTASLSLPKSEAGILYLGIQKGWDKTSNEWMQSPALQILKEVDDLLFCHLPRVERLAVAYKSFKLLKVRLLQTSCGNGANLCQYYLNATKEELDKVPEWLRPR